MKLPATFLMLLLSGALQAEKVFSFNMNCQKAYHAMMALHLEEADSLLQLEKKMHPDNLVPYFVEDYADFFVIAFSEDPSEIKKREGQKNLRLEKLKQGPASSPYLLYSQAEVLMHWSFIHMANEQYSTAFLELRKAYNLLQENQRKFPGFIANKKFIGLIHALAGSIPDQFQWAASIAGIRASVPQGLSEVAEVMAFSKENSFLFEDETRYIYLLLKLWLDHDAEAAWHLTQEPEYPALKGNPLSTYVKGYLASKVRKNDQAVELLSVNAYPPSVFVPVFIHYMNGICKLRRLDADAHVPLITFVKEFKGRNYLKDAYRAISWNFLMAGDEAGYRHWLSYCGTYGSEFTDSDKEALAEFKSGIAPNITLLRARLLTDGAYFEKASGILAEKNENEFFTEKNRIEFLYRKARLDDEWGKKSLAVPAYQRIIKEAGALPYYFAANAALHLGYIFEETGDLEMAQYYFRLCLSMKPDVYSNGIEQKAKAGLNRVSE